MASISLGSRYCGCRRRRLLRRDVPYRGTLGDRRGFPLGNEAIEAAQRGEPTVARTDRDLARLFAVLQEGCHLDRREVRQRQFGDGTLVPLGGEAQKQPPRVTVGPHRVRRDVELLDQPLVEEGVQQSGEGIERLHGGTPRRRATRARRKL